MHGLPSEPLGQGTPEHAPSAKTPRTQCAQKTNMITSLVHHAMWLACTCVSCIYEPPRTGTKPCPALSAAAQPSHAATGQLLCPVSLSCSHNAGACLLITVFGGDSIRWRAPKQPSSHSSSRSCFHSSFHSFSWCPAAAPGRAPAATRGARAAAPGPRRPRGRRRPRRPTRLGRPVSCARPRACPPRACAGSCPSPRRAPPSLRGARASVSAGSPSWLAAQELPTPAGRPCLLTRWAHALYARGISHVTGTQTCYPQCNLTQDARPRSLTCTHMASSAGSYHKRAARQGIGRRCRRERRRQAPRARASAPQGARTAGLLGGRAAARAQAARHARRSLAELRLRQQPLQRAAHGGR